VLKSLRHSASTATMASVAEPARCVVQLPGHCFGCADVTTDQCDFIRLPLCRCLHFGSHLNQAFVLLALVLTPVPFDGIGACVGCSAGLFLCKYS
jgi:hypothetical protein